MKALYILREEKNKRALEAFLASNWEACAKAGKPLAVEIKPEKSKRSLDQNAYYWKVMQQIEAQAWVEGRQYAGEVWHELAKRKFIGVIDMPGGGSMSMSSTSLSVSEFSEFVGRVEAWAASELGVQFLEGVA